MNPSITAKKAGDCQFQHGRTGLGRQLRGLPAKLCRRRLPWPWIFCYSLLCCQHMPSSENAGSRVALAH
jgi:hypothetical protein